MACFAQSTWHVDAQATPPGFGTAAAPYSSIQFAHDQAATVAGDELRVAPGVYAEDLTIHKQLHIRSSGGPAVTELRPFHTIHLYNLSSSFVPDEMLLEGFSIFGRPGWTEPFTVDANEATLRRCVVRDNTHSVGVKVNVEAWIFDSVITNNATGVFVGGFDFGIHMRNSIVFGNVADTSIGASADEVDYCAGMVTNVHPVVGVGNVFGNPQLWNLSAGDYRPAPGSPCIDAGDPLSPLDPDGSRHDIGLVPYDPTYAPGPTTYCTGKQNSEGCVPAIGWSGQASATPPTAFTIGASNLLKQKSGLLFFGFGPRAQPFQGGFHCVQLPTKRVGQQTSTSSGGACGGTFSFDMGGYIQSGVHPALLPGATVFCQWWSRDPADPTGFATSLSNALSFGIAP